MQHNSRFLKNIRVYWLKKTGFG